MDILRTKQINIGITAITLFCAMILPIHNNAHAAVSITDNFDSDLGNWTTPHNKYFKIIDGNLVNKTAYVDYIGLAEKNIGNFDLSFKLKFLQNSEKMPGHFSITINRGYGIWKLYFTSNKNTSQFTSKFYPADANKKAKALFNEVNKLPLPLDKWLKIEITCNKHLYKLKIDSNEFILGTAPGYGNISFGSYKQPVALDNFNITYEKPKPRSPNLLINGSFEYTTNTDIPDYWAGNGVRYRTQGLPAALYTEKSIEDFHKKFFMDRKTAFNGSNSIQLQFPFHLQSKNININTNNSYTISCYIKAESKNQKIKLGVTRDTISKPFKEITLNTETKWTRYTMTISDHQQQSLSAFIKPLTPGKIWVDAVQIEKGNTATQFMPCWYDSGFSLPADVNKNQCLNNTKAVRNSLFPKNIIANKDIVISGIKLLLQNQLNNKYKLNINIENKTTVNKDLNITACITAKSEAEQLKSYSKKFLSLKTESLDFDNITIRDLRVCVNIIITDTDGNIIKQIRDFIDTPKPMRIYTEWSYYTKEKEANIIVQFAENCNMLENSIIKLEVFAAGHPQYAIVRKTFPVRNTTDRQIFSVPTTHLKPGKLFTVKATLISNNKKVLTSTDTTLVTRYPAQTEIKINRINRGIYVNGSPFIPYGILVSGLNLDQLEYYKNCGFSYIQLISHWNKIEDNLTFLKNCNKLNINTIAFHIARPYSIDPADIAVKYKSSPALIGIVPNDESADRIVYDRAIRTKAANPYILNCINHHFISYRAFANRIDGLPGDILSIDRYPFIVQPPGRPQMTGDIFSYELCLEMQNRDARRERKPVFTWLQSAERFAKEPTPQQLTWQTYIALVNNCMGFSYFGGMPNSKKVWQRMQSLNKEVQSLKPALFSMEEAPEVTGADQITRENIRILAKKLGNTLTVICVNDSFYPINASINIPDTKAPSTHTAEVLFENRKITIDKKGILKDKFRPFERHVYKLKIKG